MKVMKFYKQNNASKRFFASRPCKSMNGKRFLYNLNLIVHHQGVPDSQRGTEMINIFLSNATVKVATYNGTKVNQKLSSLIKIKGGQNVKKSDHCMSNKLEF